MPSSVSGRTSSSPTTGSTASLLKLAGTLAYAKAGDRTKGETTFTAGGGAPLAVCLHRARDAGLGGLEFACAIPGTIGGAVWMNAGAYGGDLGGILIKALIANAEGTRWQTPAELGLEYRRSNVRHGQVVAAAELQLVERPSEEIRQIVADMQARRKEAQPTNKRTFGSVFKNPAHDLSAGQMLEACGLKAYRIGGAQISPKHANFIENVGGARTVDALALIGEARLRARERFGVVLEPEVELIGPIEIPPLEPKLTVLLQAGTWIRAWPCRDDGDVPLVLDGVAFGSLGLAAAAAGDSEDGEALSSSGLTCSQLVAWSLKPPWTSTSGDLAVPLVRHGGAVADVTFSMRGLLALAPRRRATQSIRTAAGRIEAIPDERPRMATTRRPALAPPGRGRPAVRCGYRVVAVVLVAVALAGLAYGIARKTSLFAVQTFDVTGAGEEIEAQVDAALARFRGKSLVGLDPEAVARAAESVPAIRTAEVERDFPRTLRVAVTTEEPVAVVRQADAAWLVAASGKVLKAVGDRRSRRAPARVASC